jgi:hypothetical protein
MFHLLIITFIFLLSGCGYKDDPKYVHLSSDLIDFPQKTESKQGLSSNLTLKKLIKREIS